VHFYNFGEDNNASEKLQIYSLKDAIITLWEERVEEKNRVIVVLYIDVHLFWKR